MPLRHINLAILSMVLLQLIGCGTITHELPIASINPQQWHWADKQQHFNLLAAMALEAEAVELQNQFPSDINSYCKGYSRLSPSQRLNFWGDLLTAISFHESRHNPKLMYKERFKDSSGSQVISRGLLQLSFESSKGYGCPLDQASQLHDPAKNIDCGVRILNRWISQDGVISKDAGLLKKKWRGAARYWSVLRQPQTLSTIQAQIQGQPYCNV